MHANEADQTIGDLWLADDSPERRAYLGHQYDHTAPAYCTCGKLWRDCRANDDVPLAGL
jgi:hypothetical protein